MATGLQAKRRVDALFKALSEDFLLREQFVTDPAQIIAEYVQGQGLSPEQATAANHFLYSVMSNPELVSWVRDYAKAHGDVPEQDDAFVADLAGAVARHGDEKTVASLIMSGQEQADLFTVQSELLRTMIGVLGRSRGNVFTGTEMSPGTGGTEMSPGTGGTEMSPGTGGTEMSPGAVLQGRGGFGNVFAGTEMSPGTGGTEMSPGTGGTEMSPGTGGTEMSPGAVFQGGRNVIDVNTTINSLVQFATELRVQGGLDVPRFR